jgi:hypothetical protein
MVAVTKFLSEKFLSNETLHFFVVEGIQQVFQQPNVVSNKKIFFIEKKLRYSFY